MNGPTHHRRIAPAPLAFAAALAACTLAPAAPLPLTELARGQSGPCAAARREVLRDPATWAAAWAAVQPTRAAPPPVAFDAAMVVAVCLGRRPTGGHDIEVVSVEAAGEALTITVRSRAPAPGALTTQALTAPFHVVSVARSDLPVRWVEVR